MNDNELIKAPIRQRGNLFEDFEIGQEFQHHWGRTVYEADSTLFSTLTLHFNPMYYNAEYARYLGYERSPINPLLVFNTIVGLSVEDLSEAGGPFLGIGKLTYGKPVYPGDTLYSRSVVIAKRVAGGGAAGPVTWRTTGYNQHGDTVVEYERTNLIRLREKQS